LNQSVVTAEDSQYAASVMPILIKNGMKAMAFVISKNMFTQLALKKFENASHFDRLDFFLTMKEAEEWIENTTT